MSCARQYFCICHISIGVHLYDLIFTTNIRKACLLIFVHMIRVCECKPISYYVIAYVVDTHCPRYVAFGRSLVPSQTCQSPMALPPSNWAVVSFTLRMKQGHQNLGPVSKQRLCFRYRNWHYECITSMKTSYRYHGITILVILARRHPYIETAPCTILLQRRYTV